MSVVVGIDFGTDFVRVAIFQNGHAELIVNADGEHHTPNIVSFTDEETVFGTGARSLVVRSPLSTVTRFKSLIGKNIDDNEVKIFKKQCAVRISEAEDAELSSPLEFVIDRNDVESRVSLESILATVLQNLKVTAETMVHKPVCDLVIAVPTHFGTKERTSLRHAAEKIGCRILRSISDPCAAALAYQLGQSAEDALHDQHRLVIDWGASGLSVTMLRIQQGYYTIVKQHRDTSLPSSVVDDALVQHIVAEFKRQTRIDLPRTSTTSRTSRAERKMYASCEEVKRCLSTASQALCSIESLHEGMDFQISLNRVRFDDICSGVFSNVRQRVLQMLLAMEINPNDVESLILAGATCRISSVQNLFKGIFPKSLEHLNSIPSDQVVALGAAIQASWLSQHPEISSYYDGSKVDVEQILTPLAEMTALPHEITMKVNGGEQEKTLFFKNAIVPAKKVQEITLKNDKPKHSFEFYMKNEGEETLIGSVDWRNTETVEKELSVEVTLKIEQDGHLNLQLIEKQSHRIHHLRL